MTGGRELSEQLRIVIRWKIVKPFPSGMGSNSGLKGDVGEDGTKYAIEIVVAGGSSYGASDAPLSLFESAKLEERGVRVEDSVDLFVGFLLSPVVEG